MINSSHPSITTDFDLIIQGAGPSGCVAALLAKRCKLRVLLIDKQSKSAYRGNAHYLNAYTLEIFHQCGLDIPKILTLATPIEFAFTMAICSSLQHIYAHSDLLSKADISHRYNKTGQFGGATNIPISTLYPELVQALEEQDIPILWNTSIDELDYPSRTIITKNHSNQERHNFSTQYVLGCDGVHSELRPHVTKEPSKTALQQFINVSIEANLAELSIPPALLYWILNPSFPGCYVVHEINGHHNLQIPIFSKRPIKELCQKDAIHHYLKNIYQKVDFQFSITNIQPWSLSSYVVDHYNNDWIFLVGDSAHCMTPAGGLGLNTSIADAANLIWKISHALKSHQASVFLNSYQQERHPVAKHVVKQSLQNFHDFKHMANTVGLPPNLAQPLLSILPQPTLPSWLGNLYSTCLKTISRIPPFQKQLQRRIFHVLEKNKTHFDGMGSHLGFDIRSQLIINDQPLQHDLVNDFSAAINPGKLWFDDTLKEKEKKCSLRLQFQYGHWLAINFTKKDQCPIQWSSYSMVDSIYTDEICSESLQTQINSSIDLLLVRPDMTISFYGSYNDALLQKQLLPLLI